LIDYRDGPGCIFVELKAWRWRRNGTS